MRLRSLELLHVVLPLKKRIAHASYERTASDNFVVRATLDDGTHGYGEGVPRRYVTGETVDTCFQAAAELDVCRRLGEVASLIELVERIEGGLLQSGLDPRGIARNAAICAVETALLDACTRRLRCSLTDVVRSVPTVRDWLTPAPTAVRYSGAITAESPRGERLSAWKMKLYGFSHVKIKVGVDGQNDRERLRRFRRILGPKVDIRLDANESWPADQAQSKLAPLLEFYPSVIEQPIAHAEVDRLSQLRSELGVPVMLDESLCGPVDAKHAIDHGLCDFFNVRLSKCGGLFASLALIDLAFRNGIKVQLGCHPGESGILSALGRHVAANVRNLAYVEGSYDRHVLAENTIEDDITFRYGGRARPLSGVGLGVRIDDARIMNLCRSLKVIHYD